MNISLRKENSLDKGISLMSMDFYAAIRTYDTFVNRKIVNLADDKLEPTCQVIGYEIIKYSFEERTPALLAVDIEIGDIGTELTFRFDEETFALIETAIAEAGYFRSKLEYFCDNFLLDQKNLIFCCYFDTKSLNKQLSTDRVHALRKYMKTNTITLHNLHDSV